jgi:hypothetical protein
LEQALFLKRIEINRDFEVIVEEGFPTMGGGMESLKITLDSRHVCLLSLMIQNDDKSAAKPTI